MSNTMQTQLVTDVTETESGAQKFLSSRDPAPRGSHVNVELVARIDTVLPGHAVPPGKHTILVSRKDAEKILARVEEHPERWQLAVDAFEREVAKAIEARFDPSTKPTPADRDKAEQDVRATISSSPSAHYHHMFGESRKPLVSARIVGDELPAPAGLGQDTARPAFAGLSIDEVELILERRAKAKKS